MGRTADLRRNRYDCLPARHMQTLVVEYQPHRAFTHFRGKLVRRLAHDAPSYSGLGASGKPNAVQLCDTATGRLWLFHKSRLVPCTLQVKCKIELSSEKGLSDFVELPDPIVHLKAKIAAHRNQKFRPLNHTRISTSIRSTASRSDHNSHTK